MSATISALVLALMLAVAPPAAAECAWVLWNTMFDRSGDRPAISVTTPQDTYRTREECEVAERGSRKLALEMLKDRPKQEMVFKCLPDTIDPRGPKGGGR